jgi:alpha-tubulin suppressor-like RCC1 family protein
VRNAFLLLLCAVVAFTADAASANPATGTGASTAVPGPVPFVPGGSGAPPAAQAIPGGLLSAGSGYWSQGFDAQNTAAKRGVASGVVRVAAGVNQTMAEKDDGSLVVWGSNYYHQLTVPPAALGASAIASGFGHLLAVKDGGVIAWGENLFGETDVPAAARSGVTAVSTATFHNLALKSDGGVVSWGLHADVPAAARSGVTAIAAGGDFSVALKGGGVLVWGGNRYGVTDVPAAARSGVTAISAGWGHVLALKSDGTIVSWGNDEDGQATVPATASSGVIAIAAGPVHSMALLTGGKVVAWGLPAAFSGLPAAASSGVSAISAGFRFCMMLK